MNLSENILRIIQKKVVSLSGNDWDMVIATMQESAINCFRCKRKGCTVCNMTKDIVKNIEQQLK
jgi:nitrogenase molybdenum-iron protein alpha/beta subunit